MAKNIIKTMTITTGITTTIIGGFTLLTSNTDNSYEEKVYSNGKIILTNEALIRTNNKVESGCVITFSDEYGKVRSYDTTEITGETCKNLKGVVDIETTNNYRHSSLNTEPVLIKVTKSLIISNDDK